MILASADPEPEEIAGTLLLDVRKFAEAHLNRRDIRKAVIAVPSYFNIAQRQGIIDAARLAGLPEVRLVNETTAAALAFAHDREGPKLVVVVDVGGGGGSVSVVMVDGGGVQVVRTCGKRLPGGDEFDIRMINYLWTVIREEHGKEVEDHRSMEILRSTWEKAKQKLSRIPHVEISTFLPAIDKELKHTIPRSLFEAECSDLFDFILHEISRTLKNAMGSLPEGSCVDHVVLVGGSSRIPHLRAEIDKLLPGKLHKALSPDEAVARGAALLAAGAVRVDREVVGRDTYVTIGGTTFFYDADELLVEKVLRADVRAKEYFAVQQASEYGTNTLEDIYEEERRLKSQVEFFSVEP
ncbi:chaperone protein DnaK-like [Thrips palmi]|uniref:Chaperone protein DnaK-like n=1 Tax=Thrips palmi TaxID=161013 RepID=A0A6P8Z8P8_THRPL|nr:chaperone protein DnaK-like [Thrips palmi]